MAEGRRSLPAKSDKIVPRRLDRHGGTKTRPNGKLKTANGKEPQRDDLQQLQLGARIRHARILKGLRMREVAEAVGCDESMISKIESGKVVPSMMMLSKIVRSLDRDMSSFFGLEIDQHKLVQSPADRTKVVGDALRGGTGVTYERLVPLAAGNLLEANIHHVAPGGEKTDSITHQGETVGYLLEGEVDFVIDGTTYRMKAGDSFFFKAHLPSGYRNTGSTVARIVWVNTPQVH
jgi:transcriptional regulator with XRE-family HTH domain